MINKVQHTCYFCMCLINEYIFSLSHFRLKNSTTLLNSFCIFFGQRTKIFCIRKKKQFLMCTIQNIHFNVFYAVESIEITKSKNCKVGLIMRGWFDITQGLSSLFSHQIPCVFMFAFLLSLSAFKPFLSISMREVRGRVTNKGQWVQGRQEVNRPGKW